AGEEAEEAVEHDGEQVLRGGRGRSNAAAPWRGIAGSRARTLKRGSVSSIPGPSAGAVIAARVLASPAPGRPARRTPFLSTESHPVATHGISDYRRPHDRYSTSSAPATLRTQNV